MTTRTLVSLVGAGVALAGGLAAWNQGYLSSWDHWLTHWFSSGANRYTQQRFRTDLIGQINQARLVAGQPALASDPLLDAALDGQFAALQTEDIHAVSRHLQDGMPRYFRLSVCSANGPTLKAVMAEFYGFGQGTEQVMTHLGCAVRGSAAGLEQHVMVAVGQRLQDFSPELLSRSDEDAFYNECPHCNHAHTVRATRQQHSLGLECPKCRLTYAVVAADENGKFRYVNEFLTGYAPPAVFSREQSRLHELFTIWTAVHENCVYSKDPGVRKNQTDNWQTSLETQRLGRGDCEDSSVFLCDWLLARGFQARVALGRYGDLGGHAWCVVKLNDKEYLLESTEGRPEPANPPLASRVGSRYVPEVLFDRFAMYARTTQGTNWSGDYWSPKVWMRIEPRQLRPGTSLMANSLQRADAIQTDPFRLARTTAPDPAAAPFAEIGEIPADAKVWQVPLPMQNP